MAMKEKKQNHHFRTIWISDTHLGTKHCNAKFLLDFLASTTSEYLYLVGDIVDLWAMKKSVYWPRQHTQVLQLIQKKADNNTKVIYTPGNHDSALRAFCGRGIGNIKVKNTVTHVTLDKRQLLVLHGDQFDSLMTAHCGSWLNLIGDLGYDFLLYINRCLGHIRRIFGFRYWSLASFIKNSIKNAMQHISMYELLLSGMAKEHQVEGIICGHIHYPHLRNIQGIEYFNTGDWVEHCTALVETTTGEIKLIRWTESMEMINPDESTPIKIAA